MAKNSGKNVPVARGEAHTGAKSSWLDLTDPDCQHPSSFVLSAQRHQHLTVRGASRGLARFSETDRERLAAPADPKRSAGTLARQTAVLRSGPGKNTAGKRAAPRRAAGWHGEEWGGAMDVSIACVRRESAKNLNFFASCRDVSV
jgi:hypothetical protein